MKNPPGGEERGAEPDTEGMPVVEHYDGSPSGFQHTVDLRDGALSVRGMMKDAERVDDVEGAIRKREVLRVCHERIHRELVQGELAPYEINAALGEVNARDACTSSRELQKISPKAAANLKKILASIPPEAGDSIHERLCPVTEPFHLIEELLRPGFEGGELSPARSGIPVFPDSSLEIDSVKSAHVVLPLNPAMTKVRRGGGAAVEPLTDPASVIIRIERLQSSTCARA